MPWKRMTNHKQIEPDARSKGGSKKFYISVFLWPLRVQISKENSHWQIYRILNVEDFDSFFLTEKNKFNQILYILTIMSEGKTSLCKS